MHTLEGLYYESDVRETIKTLPNDLDALYANLTRILIGELIATQLREDTITHLRYWTWSKSAQICPDPSVDVSSSASLEAGGVGKWYYT